MINELLSFQRTNIKKNQLDFQNEIKWTMTINKQIFLITKFC